MEKHQVRVERERKEKMDQNQCVSPSVCMKRLAIHQVCDIFETVGGYPGPLTYFSEKSQLINFFLEKTKETNYTTNPI